MFQLCKFSVLPWMMLGTDSATLNRNTIKAGMRKTLSILVSAMALGGCVTAPPATDASTNVPQPATASTGENVAGKVLPRTVKKVKGLGDWKGYIEGEELANSKFSKLEIGMGQREVADLAGPYSYMTSKVTGKMWIPFFFGSGRMQMTLHYKNVGRLVFSDGVFSSAAGLVGIEYDPSEHGYR